MGWNLPPGVTGNEWAIAGPSYERDEERTCEQQDVTIRTLTDYGKRQIENAVEALRVCPACHQYRFAHEPECPQRYPSTAPPAIKGLLTSALSETEETTVAECPFEGAVTVWGGDDGLLHWTCPVCGFESDEEPGDE